MPVRPPFFAALLTTGFALPTAIPSARAADALTPTHLRCQYRVDPLGVDATAPRLSWEVHSPQRGQKQTAYRLLVASSPEILRADRGDLWDTGKVASDETLHIAYAGRPLTSGQVGHWKVKVWDKDGRESPWSEPARWSATAPTAPAARCTVGRPHSWPSSTSNTPTARANWSSPTRPGR